MTMAKDIWQAREAVAKLWRYAYAERAGAPVLEHIAPLKLDSETGVMRQLREAYTALGRAFDEATLGAGPIVDNASEGEDWTSGAPKDATC